MSSVLKWHFVLSLILEAVNGIHRNLEYTERHSLLVTTAM